MKKFFLVLSIIALPLSAVAADKPDRMSDATIDAAVKQFGPNFCAKTVDEIKEAAEKVYDCYQKTSKDSPDYEACFLGDYAVSSIIQRLNKKTEALGKINSFGNITYFSKPEILKRTRERLDFPKYKNYTDEEETLNRTKSIKIFVDKANASCGASY